MLSDRANQLLDLEEQHPRMTGRKLYLVHSMSGNAARHFQELNRVIDDPDALRERPMLVKRLQRARERRIADRALRSHGSTLTQRNARGTWMNEAERGGSQVG